jgi:hypothetical protein
MYLISSIYNLDGMFFEESIYFDECDCARTADGNWNMIKSSWNGKCITTSLTLYHLRKMF